MTPQAQQVKKSKIFTILDLIIVVFALILCLLPLFFLPKEKGESLKITHNGQTAIYSLSQNKTIEIDGAVIKIENGKAYFESNDCPTNQCVHTGKIHLAGQTSVCMPKGIYLQIIGSQFDSSVR